MTGETHSAPCHSAALRHLDSLGAEIDERQPEPPALLPVRAPWLLQRFSQDRDPRGISRKDPIARRREDDNSLVDRYSVGRNPAAVHEQLANQVFYITSKPLRVDREAVGSGRDRDDDFSERVAPAKNLASMRFQLVKSVHLVGLHCSHLGLGVSARERMRGRMRGIVKADGSDNPLPHADELNQLGIGVRSRQREAPP